MITLIHGENTKAARDRFNTLIKSYKSRGYEIRFVDSSKDLSSQLTSSSLFSENVVFIIENPKKIGLKDSNAELVILCDQAVNSLFLKNLPKDIKNEKFDLPKKLFSFLDLLVPGNKEKLITVLHELLSSEPVELVSFMMARQFRDLYWVLVDEKSISLPTWRLNKLKSQASKFNQSKLEKLIDRFSEFDYMAKTGSVDLPTSLDLIIASELE